MNIPFKVTKLNYMHQEKVAEHQAAASKYYKEYTKLKKQSELKKLKEEVITWFFSLDFMTKLIVSSVENKWVTNLLHQLYINQKYQPNLRFLVKEGDLIAKDMTNRKGEQFFRMNFGKTGTLLEEVDYSTFFNKNAFVDPNLDPFNYQSYFKEDYTMSNDISYGYFYHNNFTNENSHSQKTGEEFIKELKFYKSEDLLLYINSSELGKYSNYFSLPEKLLKDEKLFRYYFDKLSNEFAFTNLIPISFDQKHYSFYLPEWINSRNLYSTAEIFVAFFEQVITVKYVLNKQLQHNIPKFTSHYEQTLLEKKQLIKFLNKSKKKYKDVVLHVREKKLAHNLYENSFTGIGDFVIKKLYQGNAHIYYTFTKVNDDEIVFDKENCSFEDINRRLSRFLLKFDWEGGSEAIEKFVDKLVFLNVDQIFSYDDFLFRLIYESLNELRQKESFEDLINGKLDPDECEESISGSGGNNLDVGKIAKKKRKKRKSTLVIKDGVENVDNVDNADNKKEEKEIIEESIGENMNNLDNQNNVSKYELIKEEPCEHQNNQNAQNAQKEERKYAFRFIKRKSEKNVAHQDKDNDINKSLLNDDIKCEYVEKEFLGNIMLTKKHDEETFKETPENQIPSEIKDLMNELITSVTFKLTFNHDYEKDICQFEPKSQKTAKTNTTEFSSLSLKQPASPCHSEKKVNIENIYNDNDTAYSSEGTQSCCTAKETNKDKDKDKDIISNLESNTACSDNNSNEGNDSNNNTTKNSTKSSNNTKKKSKEPKFFLYDVNKKRKKSENSKININLNVNVNITYKCSNENCQNNLNSASNDETPTKTSTSNKVFENEELNNNTSGNMDLKGKENDYKSKRKNSNNSDHSKQRHSYCHSYNKSNVTINNYYNSNSNNKYFFPNESFLPYHVPAYPYMYNNAYPLPYPSNEIFLHQNPMHFEFFQIKLHNDILDYWNRTESLLSLMKPIKAAVLNYLEKQVIDFFLRELNINSSIETYGSFASEMDIESSDIDVTIKLDACGNYTTEIDLQLMMRLNDKFNNLKEIESVNSIYTASVPVIKLVINPFNIDCESLTKLRESDEYRNYKFDKEELQKVKIDLTFYQDIVKKNNNKSISNKHVELIRESSNNFPEIKPIIKIVKRFLHVNKLNNTFNGGLSSFSVFLLLLACVRIHRYNLSNNNVNLGKLLIEFLLYYGCFFDFNFTIIDVNLENPFVVCSDHLEQIPTILDPITYNNAARSSYRIAEIKKLLNFGYERLNEIKSLCDSNMMDLKQNVIYKLLQ